MLSQTRARACRHSLIRSPRLHQPSTEEFQTSCDSSFKTYNAARIRDNERHSYLEIGTAPKTWERAHWIGGERLGRDLISVLGYAWVDESLDSPRRLVSEASSEGMRTSLRLSIPIVA